ncbi:MAG: hypothetical protein IJ802_02885, partial [Kiritimatiellae bacterium]|nr:hypothetical protein [Kiritimatiellia bacterium]
MKFIFKGLKLHQNPRMTLKVPRTGMARGAVKEMRRAERGVQNKRFAASYRPSHGINCSSPILIRQP